jgi:transposase
LRSRYRASGAKSDPADALLLAEVLGTDGHHLAARTPASEPTKILGALSRTRKDLVEARVALASTSSPASWKAGFPAPSGCSVSCTRQPLSRSWAAIAPATPPPPSPRPPSLPSCHCLHDSGRTPASELLRRPQTAPAAGNRPGRGGRTGGLGAGLGDAIQVTSRQERELEAEIIERLEVHADQHIFTSLPRAGHGVRAAALLAELGDVRARFPTEEALAAQGGAAPVTITSGKRRVVKFRWACDKKLRAALLDFADASRHASPGRPRSTPRRSSAPATTPRRAHPGPRLDPGDLAHLARRRRLRPDQTPRGGEAPGHLRLT